jgi:hypothetical protein
MRDGPGPGRAVHRGPMVAWTEGIGAWRHTNRSLAPGTPEHKSSPAGAQQREGNMGNPAQASLGLGRRHGDWATTGKWQWRESLAMEVLGLWKRGRVRWGRCGDLRGRGGLFIGPGEGALRHWLPEYLRAEGVPFNGGMKEEATRHLFLSSGGGRGGHGGGARPAAGGGWRALVRCGRRKKKSGGFRGRHLH